MTTYPEIYPIFRDDQCEIISVDGHIYARFTTEEADWNSRVRFNPLFLDRWAEKPLTRESVLALEGTFDSEDGWSNSPTSIVASGFYYNPAGWHWNLGKEAGERIRQEFSDALEDADAKYEVREYWWDLKWELKWATDPLTAVQYGWDGCEIKDPEIRHIVMTGKKHFHIMEMDDVKCLAMNAKKVRGRVWPKIQAAMDTSVVPTEPWSIKPFVDEALVEFVEAHSQDAMTCSDIRSFEWDEEEKTLRFQATDNAGASQNFRLTFDSRDRGSLEMATPGKRWDWSSIYDEDKPGHFSPLHRPGTGFDSEAEVKEFFEGRLFYWHHDSIYSFTR